MTSATAKKAALSLANVVPGTPVYPRPSRRHARPLRPGPGPVGYPLKAVRPSDRPMRAGRRTVAHGAGCSLGGRSQSGAADARLHTHHPFVVGSLHNHMDVDDVLKRALRRPAEAFLICCGNHDLIEDVRFFSRYQAYLIIHISIRLCNAHLAHDNGIRLSRNGRFSSLIRTHHSSKGSLGTPESVRHVIPAGTVACRTVTERRVFGGGPRQRSRDCGPLGSRASGQRPSDAI